MLNEFSFCLFVFYIFVCCCSFELCFVVVVVVAAAALLLLLLSFLLSFFLSSVYGGGGCFLFCLSLSQHFAQTLPTTCFAFVCATNTNSIAQVKDPMCTFKYEKASWPVV